MLTQTMPSLVTALQSVLPDQAIKALTQALGNCNQPLAHRNDLLFTPSEPLQAGPGYAGGGTWNPQYYFNILPNNNALPRGGVGRQVDIPGWKNAGNWSTSNYYGDTFNLPLNQAFTLNQYHGGPNVYNAGAQYNTATYSSLSYAGDTYTNNLYVNNINGTPVAGAPGTAGPAGAPGAPGVPGAPGAGGFGGGFFAGPQGDAGTQGPPGAQGQTGEQGADGADGATFYGGGQSISVTTGIVGPYITDIGSIDLDGAINTKFVTISVPTTATFDETDCKVTLGGFQEYKAVAEVDANYGVSVGDAQPGSSKVVFDVKVAGQ